MSRNRITMDRFFTAFQARDARTMAQCYHEDAHFQDPVFDVRGQDVRKMWAMLCTGAQDLDVQVLETGVEGDRGTARWDAVYSFSRNGRKVHNKIESRFTFRDGLIIEQKDDFNLWRWSAMALGPTGWLLGWSPVVRRRIRSDARRRLEQFPAPPLS